MASRFFDDQDFETGKDYELGEQVSHHIGKVLRMGVGDELVLFNGKGGEWQAFITGVRKRMVAVSVRKFNPDNRTAPVFVRLLLPLLKSDRMDYALQKSVELGAGEIQLIVTERTEARFAAEKTERKMQHFRQVIISACEQCGLNRIPELRAPLRLADITASPDNINLRLIAHPGTQPLPPQHVQQARAIELLTGPEGGFSETEITRAKAAGFLPFALGNRILRAETAPPALLAALWAITALAHS